MGNLIGNRRIDFMTKTCNHRERTRRDRPGNALGVEGCKIIARPSSSHHRNDIGTMLNRSRNACDDHLFRLVTLDSGIECKEVKTKSA